MGSFKESSPDAIYKQKQARSKQVYTTQSIPAKALPTPQTETKPYHTELTRGQGKSLEDKINFNSVFLEVGRGRGSESGGRLSEIGYFELLD